MASFIYFPDVAVRRAAAAILTALAVLAAGLALVVATPGAAPPAAAASVVGQEKCRRFDPNLVNGVCLAYPTPAGATAYTWIGTYRAADGRVFFCIDYLYDSRLPRDAQTVSTDDLANQLDDRVGDREVAAINYLISTWADEGSTGSDARDAAIALIIREVMADGVRGDGLVVYPRGLLVGEPVQPPVGGLAGPVMGLARKMWAKASRFYGGYRLSMTTRDRDQLRLGRSRTYRVELRSAAGHRVPGQVVTFECDGPITCPDPVRTRSRPVRIRLVPRQTGRFRIIAKVSGPAADGRLYVLASWHAHGGNRARNAGTQRGWIAQDNRARAAVADSAVIVKARPTVTTTTSDALVVPGAAIHDVVTVTNLPAGYAQTAEANLYGPFSARPGSESCTPDRLAGQVRFDVTADGVFMTPSITVGAVGYYVWTETLPGDERTVPVTTPCGIVEETTLVQKLTPRVTTVVSTQRAHVGDAITDTVDVAGIEDHPVTVAWTLHGPIAPRAGSCAGLDWTGAPIAARGSFTAAGDGGYRTTPTIVRASGCHTYSETVAATAVTNPTATPPGLPSETALAVSQPRVSTVASTQRALTGARIHDTVRVAGLNAGDQVWVRWTLHGPMAPRSGSSCEGLAWDRAPIADQGAFPATANGSYRTGATVVGATGCYTYSESVPATATSEATGSRPGLPLETLVVTKPVIPFVPEVPSGNILAEKRFQPDYLLRRYRAPADLVSRQAGSALRIPSLGVSAPVDAVGLDGSVMAIPNAPSRVGWLSGSADAAAVMGSSVISGHVSDRQDRPGAFSGLGRIQVGARIEWADRGRTHAFRVTHLATYPRRVGVPADVFRGDGGHVLRLVTCTDRRQSGGGFHYASNLVVTAVPVR
ncbi:MAG: class F sortase [Nocardioides sp.]